LPALLSLTAVGLGNTPPHIPAECDGEHTAGRNIQYCAAWGTLGAIWRALGLVFAAVAIYHFKA
jgi:hypothetical protein